MALKIGKIEELEAPAPMFSAPCLLMQKQTGALALLLEELEPVNLLPAAPPWPGQPQPPKKLGVLHWLTGRMAGKTQRAESFQGFELATASVTVSN